MKVLCTYLCDYNDRKDYYMSLMPYGITSIASYLEENGHEVILSNFSSIGHRDAVNKALELNPEIIFISIFSFNRTESFNFIRMLKKINPSIKIVAGGHHPSFLHEKISLRFPEIDYFIIGEGEITALKITEGIIEEKISQGERIEDLDSLPYPSTFKGLTIGINKFEQFRYIITSRGCPSNCTYCSSPNFWKKIITLRSPDNILEELKILQHKYGIIYFSIRDDNFTLNKKRVIEFSKKLQESGLYFLWNCQARVDTIDLEMLIEMKKAGLEHIQYGVESGSDRILKIYDKSTTSKKIKHASKITREAGIYLSCYLMAGMKGETDEDINKTIQLIQEMKPHDIIVSPVAYYPGTDIYFEHRDQGFINDEIWFERKDNGLFIENPDDTQKWVSKIANAGEKIKKKSRYMEIDFKSHREITGEDCWITDILEGDYYIEINNIKKSQKLFKKVIKNHPNNIWGYLRLAEVTETIEEAEQIMLKATKIVPQYHGTWLRLGEIQFEMNHKSQAKKSLKKAIELNSQDPQTLNLIKLLS